jgi:hypothetical protein
MEKSTPNLQVNLGEISGNLIEMRPPTNYNNQNHKKIMFTEEQTQILPNAPHHRPLHKFRNTSFSYVPY